MSRLPPAGPISAVVRYQSRDAVLGFDYDLVSTTVSDGSRHWPLVHRGPAVGEHPDVCCLGAAQTFGRYVRDPFPAQLARQLARPVLNLGFGGLGPEGLAGAAGLLRLANRARVVVLQVLSGRSVSSSNFRLSAGGRRGVRRSDGRVLAAPDYVDGLLGDPPALRRYVRECRAGWLEAMHRVLDALSRPVILLWLAHRTPASQAAMRPPGRATAPPHVWNRFPHLVDVELLAPLRARVADYVEVVAPRQRRVIARAGERRAASYYPGPALHAEAAARLLGSPALRGRG